MKLTLLLQRSLLIAALPLAALAQAVNTPAPDSFESWGPHKGTREITIAGSGGSNKSMDDSFGGASVSYGMFFSDTLEGSVRQTVNYSNPSVGSAAWNGSTRIAVDQHFGDEGSRLVPYAGVNFGYIYGDLVRDTWAGGLEAGAKYYVQPKTFVYAGAEYSWFFQHANDVDERFDEGQFTWSVGMGFNF